MKVAYLVNQYPHVSHSFIRREIAALEELGVAVERFSVRPSPADLVDPADQAEQKRTQILLGVGLLGLLTALLRTALSRPGRLFKGLRWAVRMGRRSERGVLRHLVYLAEACVLVRQLRACGADHLHAHFGTNSASVAFLTRLLGGPPYSFTVHGPEEFDRPDSLSLKDKIEHAAFVVGVSSFWAQSAVPLVFSRILVKSPCGPLWGGCGLPQGPQPVADTPRLVCVGRLSEQKGQVLLLDAMGRLAAEGVAFEMVLAGDGPMRGIIEERIKRLKLEGRVRITGWLSNAAVRQEILAARALVLPSFAEGLPVVLMEALALGRPVVTTYIAGIPELVEGGGNGWLIPAGSVEALAEALREVLQTSVARLEQMGKAGAVRVAAMHDAQREAARLADLFRTAVSA